VLPRRPRALAVPLERASASSSRRWYRPASEPLPSEPGRLVVIALLARARRERGCTTPGDDRLETRAYAVKRYLFRLGHARRSARFATSIGQLVVGLAPVIGWGPVPSDPTQRAAFIRAHRRSVQRWLDDLESAGVAAHEPERDSDGVWWRTQIVLLAAPVPTKSELLAARARARTWGLRERRRQERTRVAPTLAGIRGRSGVPRSSTRARIARGRELAAHESRRRARVEAQLQRAQAHSEVSRDLTHPFGAPPTSAVPSDSANRWRRSETAQIEGPAAIRPAPTMKDPAAVADKTGAHGRAARATVTAAPAPQTAGTEEVRRLSRGDFDALVRERLAAASAPIPSRFALIGDHVRRRVEEVSVWPAGSRCPLGRLREAWAAHRYGLASVVDSGSVLAGKVGPRLATRVGRAIELYDTYAQHRPPTWPASGAAALCALASQHRADRFAGDVARLRALAKRMKAIALEEDSRCLANARRRAAARKTLADDLRSRRLLLAAPRYETAERRRERVRDAVLLAGDNPAKWPNAALALAHHPALAGRKVQLLEPDRCEELDGVGARAGRYRDELAAGVWLLPSTFAPSPPASQEVSAQWP